MNALVVNACSTLNDEYPQSFWQHFSTAQIYVKHLIIRHFTEMLRFDFPLQTLNCIQYVGRLIIRLFCDLDDLRRLTKVKWKTEYQQVINYCFTSQSIIYRAKRIKLQLLENVYCSRYEVVNDFSSSICFDPMNCLVNRSWKIFYFWPIEFIFAVKLLWCWLGDQ